MEQVTITHKNGIATSEVISINSKNIIKYANNSAGYAELLYDLKDPVTYVLSITKTALDALLLLADVIPLLYANILDPTTGASTATTFNENYVLSLKDSKAHIAGVLDETVVELICLDKSFTNKKIYANGTVATLTRSLPSYLKSLSYAALLTQTSTGAPVETILEDTITGQVWARSSAGTYTLTKTGAYTVGKTIPSKVEEYYDVAGNRLVLIPTSVNVFTLQTYAAADTNTLVDGVLSAQYIFIQIYR